MALSPAIPAEDEENILVAAIVSVSRSHPFPGGLYRLSRSHLGAALYRRAAVAA